MARKHIVFPYIETIYSSKSEALTSGTQYLVSKGDYEDGEEILLRYYDTDGKVVSFNAVVNVRENEVYLSTDLNDSDTVRIVDSETEPEDKDVLWLTEQADYDASQIRDDVASLRKQVRILTDLLLKHDYALTHVLQGGDFITNSIKYRMENESEKEQPDDSEDYTEYSETDTAVTDFDLYIGNTPLTYYSGVEDGARLYYGKKYYLNVRLFNISGERVNSFGVLKLIPEEDFLWTSENLIYASESKPCTLHANLTVDGTKISKTYVINFAYNEEPAYDLYTEPNSPHITVKQADTYEQLSSNSDYLCINEFVWCKEKNTLYLKATSSNGQVALFTINGGSSSEIITGTTGDDTGSTIDTGTTTGSTSVAGVTYIVNDKNELVAASTDGSIKVDDNGILNLVAYYDEETGMLIFQNREAQVSTDSTGGDTSSDTDSTSGGDSSETSARGSSTINSDSELEMSSNVIDSEGYLTLNSINSDGIITL